MDEALGVLFLGMVMLLLLSMLITTQSIITTQSHHMKRKLNEERTRIKEAIHLSWLGGDELLMVNTGPKGVTLTHIYYYEVGRRVPSGYADVNIHLEPGESKVVEVEKLRTWPPPAEIIDDIPKTPSNEYLICHDGIYENHLSKKEECFSEPDSQFPSIDTIKEGVLGYSLYRGVGSDELNASLPYGDSDGDGVMEGLPPYTWSICSWLKLDANVNENFPLLVVDPNYGEIDPSQDPYFEFRYDPSFHKIYATIETNDPSVGEFEFGREGSNPGVPTTWNLYCLSMEPADPYFTSYRVRFYVNTTLVNEDTIEGLPTGPYGWGIWFTKVYELNVSIPSGQPTGYWLDYIVITDLPLYLNHVNIFYKSDWFPAWAATWSFDFLEKRPLTGARIVTSDGKVYETYKVGVPVRGVPQLIEFRTVNEYGCFSGCIWSCYGGGCYWSGWGG